jgi:hypothetical protein
VGRKRERKVSEEKVCVGGWREREIYEMKTLEGKKEVVKVRN